MDLSIEEEVATEMELRGHGDGGDGGSESACHSHPLGPFFFWHCFSDSLHGLYLLRGSEC